MVSLLGIFGAVFKVITTFIRWLLDGLVVCIAHPVTAAVLLAVLVVGFYFGVRHDEAALMKLKTEMVQADVQSKHRLEAAETARKAAEDKVLNSVAAPVAAGPAEAAAGVSAPPSVKRVRHKSSNCGGSWMSGVQALWGGCK